MIDRLQFKGNLINISKFAQHYSDDVDSWIMRNKYLIDALIIDDKSKVLSYIDSEWFACRELAIKYAQYLSPEMEVIILRLIAKAIEPNEPPEGSIFSFKFTSHLNLPVYYVVFVNAFF